MENNKGFTLVELLATITILAIIGLITIPVITKSINSATNNAYEVQEKALILGAKSWGADEENFYKLPISGQTISVTLKDLKTGGYVDSDITNVSTNEKFDDDCTKVDISNINGKLSYKVNLSTCKEE